uniref:Uncharacterized protein n=2 Tax=Oryza TaxID=4527 RepID=A0A0E0IQA1_ORYNI
MTKMMKNLSFFMEPRISWLYWRELLPLLTKFFWREANQSGKTEYTMVYETEGCIFRVHGYMPKYKSC